MSISEREQGNPHNKIALFETKCNDMLHLTILQYNTRINDICFPKKTLMCILRCHEHLWYICETTFEQLPYHTLKICSNLKCGNNFFQYATSRMSPFHDFKILVNEILNSQISPLTFSVQNLGSQWFCVHFNIERFWHKSLQGN